MLACLLRYAAAAAAATDAVACACITEHVGTPLAKVHWYCHDGADRLVGVQNWPRALSHGDVRGAAAA